MLTYAEVGATRRGPLPPGYRHLSVRHRLGRGDSADLARCGEALLGWRVHAAARIPVVADGPRAAPGTRAEAHIGVGRLRVPAPCEVVWVQEDRRAVGFGYGTLEGHAFRGEEAFVVERDADGLLWFVVRAFSVPALPVVALGGPVVPVFQRAFLAQLAHGARRVLDEGR